MTEREGDGVARSPCSCTALRKASRRMSQLYDAALAPCGLSITQRAILGELRRSEPATVGQLAGALVMDGGALAHTLKPLERDGYLSVGIDPQDRRARLISLTAAGRAKLVESDPLWEKAQRSFDTAFGNAEAAHLRAALAVLSSARFTAAFDAALS